MLISDFYKTGFRFISEKIIEFILDPLEYEDKVEENEDVYLSGPFNNWVSTADSSWKMNKVVVKDKTLFTIQKKFSDINIPGNSGFVEFRFFGITENSYRTIDQNPPLEGYTVNNNKVIVYTEEDCKKAQEMDLLSRKIIPLSNFDLNCPACKAQITNIRPVPGTRCFFRGYHPYKKSRPEFDTEQPRINLVQKFYELYQIKSDITLCGYEGAQSSQGEFIPDCIKKIEKAENRICLNLDYFVVYFHSQTAEYIKHLSKIAHFIIEHPAPFYIHCRLGSDRTGVTCAVFASICGATWDEIAHDFERTSKTGIGEVRSKNILKYSILQMTGKDPETSADLQQDMKNFFIQEKILNDEEIEILISKLQENTECLDEGYFNFTEEHICKNNN